MAKRLRGFIMHHPRRSRSMAMVIAPVILAMMTMVWASDGKAEPPQTKKIVAATVHGEPIHEADVKRSIDRSVDRSRIASADLDRLRAAVLERLIERRLVQSYLDRNKLSASGAEVELRIKQLKGELKDRKKTWQDYLTLRGLSEAKLRREMRWQMSWRRHVEKQITDVVLKTFFTKHARDYDGRRLRISQILLQPTNSGDAGKAKADEIKRLMQQAETLRTKIVENKLTFAEAARRYSDAPSKAQGGEQGWITRDGEYGETFSKAAFALDAGQISRPVVTGFGVHLIECTKIEPGKKTWTDVSAALRRAATAELFQRRAQAERPRVEVKYTGAMPHLDSGSGRVVGGRR